MTFSKLVFGRVLASLIGLLLLAGFCYWLLPVSPSSALSADHVRWVFSDSDVAPVLPESLFGLWAVILLAIKLLIAGVSKVSGFALPEAQIFSTSAATSAWLCITAIAILSFNLRFWVLLVVVLTPTVWWTAVVPNGFSVGLFLLALMSALSKPSVLYESRPKRWIAGAVVDGLACSMTPAAWILVLLRNVHSMDPKESRKKLLPLRAVLFVVGFSVSLSLAVLLDSSSAFSSWPVVSVLSAIRTEDFLSAGAVLVGGGGEVAIGLLASLTFVIAITLSPEWRSSKFLNLVRWLLLVSPFFVLSVSGRASAWHLAHPGGNTIFGDYARNIVDVLPEKTIVFVRSVTEEASLRYRAAVIKKSGEKSKKNSVVLRPIQLFDSATLARVRAVVSHFHLVSGSAASPLTFLDAVVVPNLIEGTSVWLDSRPELTKTTETGLDIQFLGTGVLVRAVPGPSRFQSSREKMKETYIRFHPTAWESLSGRSLEIQIFERYAGFHLNAAQLIEFEKQTSDWKRRARGEYYAALRKVPWFEFAYKKVCIDEVTLANGPENTTGKTSIGATPPEPLEICKDLEDYYNRSS